MPDFSLVLTGMCLALLGLWLGVLGRRPSHGWREGIIGALACGVICSLLIPLALDREAPVPVLLFLVAGQSGIAFFYWMLSREIVADDFRPAWTDLLVFAAKILVTLVSVNPRRPFLLPDLSALEQETMRYLPPAVFSAALVGLGLWSVYRGLRNDLVESRRRQRLQLLALSGLVILVIIAARLAFQGDRLDRLYESVRMVLTLAVLYYLTFSGLKLRPDFLSRPVDRDEVARDASPELLARLRALFEEERIYRTEGLTIRACAVRLEVPEYRVRRLINGSLGYRNFNDFLNRYRIEEARRVLLERTELPVLRVAMDLGFRSLSAFNRAFKDLTGLTPTAYRERSRDGSREESP